MSKFVADGRMVACLQNAEAAAQTALDCAQDIGSWGDWEDALSDAAYGHIEQIRALLTVIEERLLGVPAGTELLTDE